MKFSVPSKLSTKKLVVICVFIAVAIALVAAYLWVQKGKKDAVQPAAVKAALSVNAVSPSNGALGLKLLANGNVAAWQEAIIGAEVNGLKLTEVRVNVGDAVKKGQILAIFSADTARADVLQAQATLAEAQATLSEAAANAARARSLQDTGALSAQQIAQYTTAETTAKEPGPFGPFRISENRAVFERPSLIDPTFVPECRKKMP